MTEIINKSEGQERAEADVDSYRKRLGPFVTATEMTRMPVVFTDAKAPGNPIIFANDSFLRLTGYSREEVLGQEFNFIMALGGSSAAIEQIAAAFEGNNDFHEIHYRRKDGSEFWATVFVNAVLDDEAGNIVQYFASFMDVTRRKEEEAQSKMLIAELNHRVKNMLAMVRAIASQAFRNSCDLAVIKEAIDSRIFALSRSHDLLSRESWQPTGLREIIMAALEPFGIANGCGERFTVNGDNVRFSANAALALSIAFNELATNAAQYGAFSNEIGSVLIEWTVRPSPNGERLVLHWREQDGPPVGPPSHTGFGSRVIERGIAHELQGTVDLDYRPDGVVCTIDIPAPQRRSHD